MGDMATEIRASDVTAKCFPPLDEARSVADSVRLVVDDEVPAARRPSFEGMPGRGGGRVG